MFTGPFPKIFVVDFAAPRRKKTACVLRTEATWAKMTMEMTIIMIMLLMMLLLMTMLMTLARQGKAITKGGYVKDN